MRVQLRLNATWLAVIALASAGVAQIRPVPRTWSRTYGGSCAGQGLFDLRQTLEGQLVVAGYSCSFGGPGNSNWILNLKIGSGDVGFERVSGSTQGDFTDGARIAVDGGALFLGRDVIDIFTKHDAWLVRVDDKGNVVWTQGFTRPGAGRHFLLDAEELADGSWVVVGATGIFDFPPQPAWIVRLSAAGVPLWHYEYGGGGAESANAVTLTSDGGFAVAGATTSSGAGSDDVWVMKINATGSIQWQKTFGGVDADQAEDIVELGDGGFAVAGSTNSLTPSGHAPWLLRLSSTGALLWHKAVASGVWGDLGGVARTNDGHAVVVGRAFEPGFASNDLWCAKFSAADGSILWQRAYEGDSGDFGSVVLPLAGTGGFIVGGTWGWGFGDESIWLQRTGRMGQLFDCELVRTLSFTTISPPITAQNSAFDRAPGGAQTMFVGGQVAPSQAQVTDRCD
jgi:hypothetical protein